MDGSTLLPRLAQRIQARSMTVPGAGPTSLRPPLPPPSAPAVFVPRALPVAAPPELPIAAPIVSTPTGASVTTPSVDDAEFTETVQVTAVHSRHATSSARASISGALRRGSVEQSTAAAVARAVAGALVQIEGETNEARRASEVEDAVQTDAEVSAPRPLSRRFSAAVTAESIAALNAAAAADIDAAGIPEIAGYLAGNVRGRHEFSKTTVLPPVVPSSREADAATGENTSASAGGAGAIGGDGVSEAAGVRGLLQPGAAAEAEAADLAASAVPAAAAPVVPTFAPGSPFDIALQAKVTVKGRRLRRPHKPEQLKRLQRGAEEYARRKAAKELGRIINKEHKQYQTSFAFMLGIYSSVVNSQVGSEKLVLDDFMRVRKLVFPPGGTRLTPPHSLPAAFKFKDYAPLVFHHLRQRFAIDQKTYLASLGGAYEYIEFNSNSKSGAFFFYSHDGKFMIKTQSKAESKFLRRILAHYFQYISRNPHTYLTRFYGMHRIKLAHLQKTVHIVVMQSVFYGDNTIHEMYDLKGSTVGRAATERERARGPSGCVYKDNDLSARGVAVKLGPGRREAFLAQLASDAAFLRAMGIMDYSLLLGIHYRSRRDTGDAHALLRAGGGGGGEEGAADAPGELPGAPEALAGAGSSAAGSAVVDAAVATSEAAATATAETTASAAGPPRVPGSAAGARAASPTRRRERAEVRGSPTAALAAATRVSGPILPPQPDPSAGMGIRGREADGSAADELYYMGIIDILQQYDLRKRGETMLRALYQPTAGISAVSPRAYADRFVAFMAAHSQ